MTTVMLYYEAIEEDDKQHKYFHYMNSSTETALIQILNTFPNTVYC